MRVRVNNIELAYSLSGNGIPLLFIHGFPLTGKIWDAQLTDLNDIAQMVAVDLRGHGESQLTPGPFSQPVAYEMEVLASDCIKLLDNIGLNIPVVVCGLSMGGYVALNIAHAYPERLAGLILVATRASADTAEARANRDAAVDLVQDRGSQVIAAQMLPKLLAMENTSAYPELVERVNGIMESVPATAMIGDLLGMKARPDATPWLSAITVPTLLVHGAGDQIIPFSEMEAMAAEIPDSRLVSISAAGHLPNMEQPEKFNQVVRQYLSDLDIQANGD